jgi:hypothetical protein
MPARRTAGHTSGAPKAGAAQPHAGRPMKNMRTWFFLLLLFASSVASAETKEQLAERYLNDLDTPAEIKEAIRSGVVVKGMCPFQAFAAAGLPGPYMVMSDKEKWKSNVPPPRIISAQCKNPDNSVIELMFKNRTQFGTDEPVVFRVRFKKGIAVLIDQGKFNDD